MPQTIAHFVFSDSFAGSLIRALRDAGRTDAVYCWLDDLGFGPINPPDPATRLEWIERELMTDFGNHIREIERLDNFRLAVAAPSVRRIVWVSKHVARESADFLEWVWRLGDAPYDVVEFDVAEVAYRRADGQTTPASINSLSLLTPEHLVAERYWDRAKPFDVAERDRCRNTWARLRRENAPLRILTEGGLVSAPLFVFDDLVVSCVVDSWRKVARVLGEALGKLYDGPFHQTGEWVLQARILALVAADRLESRGDISRPRFSEVRLPTRESTKSTAAVDGC